MDFLRERLLGEQAPDAVNALYQRRGLLADSARANTAVLAAAGLWEGAAPHAGFALWAPLARDIDLLHAGRPLGAVLRLLDANRAEDDIDPAQLDGAYPHPLRPSVKSQLGIGLVWTRVPPEGGPMYAQPLTATQVLARVETFHRPYHQALRRLLDASHTRWGAVWHINCHSMQNHASAMSTQPRGTPRPDFVLGDRDGTSCEPAFTRAVAEFLRGRGYDVAINDPYKGMELIRANGDPARARHSMQIEVNRRLYMNELTREPHDGFAQLQSTFTELARHLAGHITRAAQP